MSETTLAGKRILVVEDDMLNMAIVAVLLKHHEAVVIQDSWNTNTLHLITEYLPIDVILLDLMLRHHRSGYEIFAQIKAVPALSNIPVIAVSAADPAIEIPKTQELGFAGFISKPIDSRKFPTQIIQCIEKRPVWG